jgi:hypothetical protein
MKKNKNYSYLQIVSFANKEDYQLNELGGNTVGVNFITLEHNHKDIAISFVLTGYSSTNGNEYTCIYADKEYSI